ncbi:hypothetical protein [Hydrogenophaga laconesensis]|jgi:hypothetical protein|uniref:Uncharacterized protein n=1 Tax=Hydrogenophaga laconesensis TaxID=1805971 RepID=A0ABU1V949_9BURK|nr:hypothetical protein [Hydrogenophaga laconesensis]MDR7093947.1 hypothetical protein [Hydrogenophaga laconesensis]
MNARLPQTVREFEVAEPPVHFEWQSRFGLIVIDIVDGVAYVNGERVEPAVSEAG